MPILAIFSVESILSACVSGLIGNRLDAGAMLVIRNLANRGLPQNHHVLKAMHGAFCDSIAVMARACDPVGGTAADNFARRALDSFAKSKTLTQLKLDAVDLPIDLLEQRVRAIYGHQDRAPKLAATELVIEVIEVGMGTPLGEAHREVFRDGHERYPGWADCYELFFAAEVKKNTDLFRIIAFDRLNELTAVADASREQLCDLADAIAEIRKVVEDGFAETQALIRRDKHKQALDELERGIAGPDLVARYEQVLAAVRAKGQSVTFQAAADAAITADALAASDDPRDRDVTSLLEQSRFREAARLRAEVAESNLIEASRPIAEQFREAGRLALPFSPYEALGYFTRATDLDPEDVWSWIELGRLRIDYDSLAAARACFGNALQRVTDERDRMVLHNEFGEFLFVAEGHLDEARSEYQSAHAIAERLAAAEPGNATWQHDLSICHEGLGDVEIAADNLAAARQCFEAALAIRERLAAAEPGNATWQRALSISHDRLGDVEVAVGELAAACQRFELSLAIRERLAVAEPGNTEWQRDLSISHEKLGGVKVEMGDLAVARQRFEAALAIRERLAAAEPGNATWQHDLSISHDWLGVVEIAADNLAAARQCFEAALAIRERLAAAEPGNATWQHDLLGSHQRLGDVEVAASNFVAARQRFEASHAIAERLVAAEKVNATWQQDLSICHDRLGDVEVAAGDLAAARQRFEASHAIAARLAAAEPSNTGGQAHLSVSHERLGDVEVAAGNFTAGRWRFEASHAIAARLAAAEPGNARWQRYLSVSHNKLGGMEAAAGNLAAARQRFEASLAIRERLVARWPDHPLFAKDLEFVRARLGSLG